MGTEMTELRRTPLFHEHQALGGKFVEFGGWEMPVQYSGLVDEHVAVRNAVGLFDVSHMGEIEVHGPKALDYLQYVTSNDVAKLTPGRAQYSLLTNERGGVVDDIIVYMLEPERYLLCVNAANAAKDLSWLRSHEQNGATIVDRSADFAQIAIQGPKAATVLATFLGVPQGELSVESFKPFSFIRKPYGGDGELLIARTGYTGEDGFEIFCSPQAAAS
ncbi:MAG: glycine cleavage system aminomethyltransferase GcvT, partial [Bdellovibrionales bacterium]|nr:glycine cleavage system aminomethyltransferase GcvT [Bdellovibrionales bacterium]